MPPALGEQQALSLLIAQTARLQVLNFRTMYIMADLAEEHEPPHSHEVVLVCVKAFADGSFDMRPGFSRPGKKYRFEDDRGACGCGVGWGGVGWGGERARHGVGEGRRQEHRFQDDRRCLLAELAIGGREGVSTARDRDRRAPAPQAASTSSRWRTRAPRRSRR